MWRCLAVVATAAVLWTPRVGGSFTSGFPSLDAVRGNASLLDRFTTHDGEWRSVPISVNKMCSGEFGVTKITFIALPGDGNENITLSLNGSVLNGTNNAFGEFGYEMVLEPFNLSGADSFWIRLGIRHPHHNDSGLRLLHKVGDEMLNITWRWLDEDSEDDHSETAYDYPLLAFDTEPPGCIEGLLNATELRSMWENRTTPVIYSSPNREIPLNCSGPGNLTRILVGAYGLRPGNQVPCIRIGNNCITCNPSPSPPATLDGAPNVKPNVYKCLLADSSVEVGDDDFLHINQRRADLQIGFIYNGTTDTPLISIDINGECSSSGFLSEGALRKMAALYIPSFNYSKGGRVIFSGLNVTQAGYLVKWTFAAEYLGAGGEYPALQVYRGRGDNIRLLPNQSMADPILTTYPNVYDCIIEPRLLVQAGNTIGLEFPSRESARLLLSILFNHGSVGGMSPSSGDLIDGLPLITLKILPLGSMIPSMPPPATTTPTDPTSQPPVSSSSPTLPTDTTERGSSSDSTGAVVGAVMGLLVAVILVIVVVILLVLVLRRKKERVSIKEGDMVVSNNNASSHVPMDNPVYSGRASEPGRQEPEYQAPSPPTISTAATAASGSQVYEVLDNVAGGGGKPKRNFENPAYYSTLQDVHSTTDKLDGASGTAMLSPNHYEMGIYVPTQAQRVYAETSGPMENVYATLEETQASHEGKTLSFFEECDTYWRPASTREDLYQQLAQRKYREIPRHQIQITDHLGSGQFGTVNRGVWQVGGQGGVEVAVKMLQEGTAEEDAVRFLQEAAINGQFRHPNIVQLLGVVTMGKPVMIVLELLSNGDLRNYLLKHKPAPGELPLSDTAGLLSQFCLQVAEGMDYLSSKSFVHRDLAARNILITDDKKCKISDFGMSRDLEEGTYYVSHGGKVPVKWTAPEALHYKKYSTASDVWSFGCLMYEIWSLGHKPFEGYTNPDTIKLVDNGRRLAPPPGCPREMYRLMIACWNGDKSARPQFSEVVQTLSQSEHELLHIPEEVTRGHPQASVLGAPLEAGSSLYTELQNTYMP